MIVSPGCACFCAAGVSEYLALRKCVCIILHVYFCVIMFVHMHARMYDSHDCASAGHDSRGWSWTIHRRAQLPRILPIIHTALRFV
jgi:hypothetical protein